LVKNILAAEKGNPLERAGRRASWTLGVLLTQVKWWADCTWKRVRYSPVKQISPTLCVLNLKFLLYHLSTSFFLSTKGLINSTARKRFPFFLSHYFPKAMNMNDLPNWRWQRARAITVGEWTVDLSKNSYPNT
jgi:hypothetical protein